MTNQTVNRCVSEVNLMGKVSLMAKRIPSEPLWISAGDPILHALDRWEMGPAPEAGRSPRRYRTAHRPGPCLRARFSIHDASRDRPQRLLQVQADSGVESCAAPGLRRPSPLRALPVPTFAG